MAGRVGRVGADEVEHDVGAGAVRRLTHASATSLVREHLVRAELLARASRRRSSVSIPIDGAAAEHAQQLQRDVARRRRRR